MSSFFHFFLSKRMSIFNFFKYSFLKSLLFLKIFTIFFLQNKISQLINLTHSMEIELYIQKKKEFYSSLINFIESPDDFE